MGISPNLHGSDISKKSRAGGFFSFQRIPHPHLRQSAAGAPAQFFRSITRNVPVPKASSSPLSVRTLAWAWIVLRDA